MHLRVKTGRAEFKAIKQTIPSALLQELSWPPISSNLNEFSKITQGDCILLKPMHIDFIIAYYSKKWQLRYYRLSGLDAFSHSQIYTKDLWRQPILARKLKEYDIEQVNLTTNERYRQHHATYEDAGYKGVGFPINYRISSQDLAVRLVLPHSDLGFIVRQVPWDVRPPP